MAEEKARLNVFDDHPRWEDYKYDKMRFPHKDGGSGPGSSSKSRRFKPRKSLIKKEGNNNVAYRGAVRRGRTHYVRDFYTTLVDAKWRWVLLLFFSCFLASYLAFAILYWLLSYMHGDFHHGSEPGWEPCIRNVHSFLDSLLLSIETQSTIGYGILYPQGECGGTIPVIYLQTTLGFLMEFVLLSVIFVKIARPKHRRHTLMFSRNACLCQEDGHLVLQFRVGDMRRTHLIDTKVHGMLVQKRLTQEKQVYPLYQHNLAFNVHGITDGRVFLLWPLVFTHRIDHTSPLYNIKPEDLLYDKFEILIFLEGTIESVGETVQARTSYTAREILWGHRFARVEEYDEKNDIWCMDFVRFDNVLPSPTPKCSAREFWLLGNGTQRGSQKDSLRRSVSQGELERLSLSSADPYDTASEEEQGEGQQDRTRLTLSSRRLSS